MCPRKHAERKINRCRVESVYGVVQINPEVVVHIELACRYNQGLGKITIDAPITVLVSINQSCRFRKLRPLDSQTPANQNMIAGCSQLPSFSSAHCATISSRDDG